MAGSKKKAMEWMLRCKAEFEKELPIKLAKVIEERDGWFLVALNALLRSTKEEQEEFVEKVLGKHIGFDDGSVWEQDFLFP